MKLFAALGPGDIVAARHSRRVKSASRSETSIMFSEQLVEFCSARQIDLLAISSNGRVARLSEGRLQLENRPRAFDGRGGALFHLSRILYAAYLAYRAYKHKADVALIDSGTSHYFALSLFRMLGIKVGVNMHNVLWPAGYRPNKFVPKTLSALDRVFFRNMTDGVIGVSPECGKQVDELAGKHVPFFEYRAQYSREGLPDKQKRTLASPFRVIFAGRIEENKGVFDLVEIARSLRTSGTPTVFDVCGDGSALPRLTKVVSDLHLADIISLHGRLPRDELLRLYNRGHALIVPTRSDFSEGLPLVCAEAVICGLPIITSRVSNALDVLRGAVAETVTDDIESYARAIRTISSDAATYERMVESCDAVSLQFFDRRQSYPAAIDGFLQSTLKTWATKDDYNDIFSSFERG